MISRMVPSISVFSLCPKSATPINNTAGSHKFPARTITASATTNRGDGGQLPGTVDPRRDDGPVPTRLIARRDFSYTEPMKSRPMGPCVFSVMPGC